MNYLHIFGLAIALAMDAFAVAIATGVTLQKADARQTFRLAWHFGLFQALMPIIGWSSGLSVRTYMERYAHWIAFALLLFVGLNMIRSAFQTEDPDTGLSPRDPTRGLSLVLLSTAVSIDALAVGFSMSILTVSIWLPALFIGLVAGFLTVAGLFIGQQIGSMSRFSTFAEILGGGVLLAIGAHILIR